MPVMQMNISGLTVTGEEEGRFLEGKARGLLWCIQVGGVEGWLVFRC